MNENRTVRAITAGIPYPPYPCTVKPVDALTAPDQGEADTTPAAEALYWLTHPEAPPRRSALADLIHQWETEPEWTPDQEPAPDDDLDDAG